MRLFLSASRVVFRVGSGITAKRAYFQSLERPTAAPAVFALKAKASNANSEPPISLEANRSQTKRSVTLARARGLEFVVLTCFALFATFDTICRGLGWRLRLVTILAAAIVLYAYGAQAQTAVFVGAANPLGGGFTTPGAVPSDGSNGVTRGIAVDASGNIFVACARYLVPGVAFVNGAVYELDAASGHSNVTTLALGPATVSPSAVAVDRFGNVYVTDAYNKAVYELVAASGFSTVRTLGSGWLGPVGVAVDTAGDVFVADGDYIKMIRAVGGTIPASPTISTLVNGTVALLIPNSVAVDASGNLFFASTQASNSINLGVSEMKPPYVGGWVQLAGSVSATSLALDANGNVFFTDAHGYSSGTVKEIQKVGGAFPPVQSAVVSSVGSIFNANSLAIDASGNFYVTDGFSPVVYQLASLGSNFGSVNVASSVLLASPTPKSRSVRALIAPTSNSASAPIPLTFRFNSTAAIGSTAVLTQGAPGLDFTDTGTGNCTAGTYSAGSTCTINVSFSPTRAGVRYGAAVLHDGSGNVLATGYVQGIGLAPQVNFPPGQQITIGSGLTDPTGVAVDAQGTVYTTNSSTGQVLKETVSGATFTQSTIASGLSSPTAIALDGAGNVYIVDSVGKAIYKATPSGGAYTLSTFFGALNTPMGIAVDGRGNVYVADSTGKTVYALAPTGSEFTSIGTGLVAPYGVAVDGSGYIYISDTGSSTVVKETPFGDSYQQVAVASGLGKPEGLATDGFGNVYISDAGVGEVLMESASAGGYTQAVVPASGLIAPGAVAVDGNGNVYIADSGNNRIVKEDFADPPRLTFTQSTTATASPETVTLANIGNATLAFSIPTSGTNPSVGPNFTLDSSLASACPLVTISSSAPGALGPFADCILTINFTPTTGGTVSDSLVLTDNNLNGNNVTQSLAVSGTSTVVASTTTLTSSANPQVSGQTMTLTATVTGSGTTTVPTGSVVFSVDGTSVATVAISSAGIATYTTSALTAGTHTILATYGGSPSFATSSASLTETISQPQTSAPVFSLAAGTYTSQQTVTLTDATAGAIIYYTTNGTVPTTASTKYTAAITVSATETIEAIAVATNYANSAVATRTYTITPPAATPTFSVAAGTYTTTQTVTIADATAGATIYYTTNGTTPTTASTKYTAAITVSSTETIEAIAVATNYVNSAVATATYTITPPAATPTFGVAAGTYTTTQTVTLADATAGATIYYTTNGTVPTTASTKYTAAITVSATETMEAIAVATNYANSAMARATYTITPPAATPTFSVAAGTYTTTQTVTIADVTAGATIYYTTNGTTPTTASTKYTAAITVSATETIEAIAVATNYANSAVAKATYTITPPAATPTFRVAAGTYTTTQTVTIADATAGATIYYTTNGTVPTTASAKYTAAITVSATETIEAIAVASGHANSAVVAATYAIMPPAATPRFNLAAGTYAGAQTVLIANGTIGATIYYTTNGTTPTTASTKYTAAITISATETLEAIAVASGYSNSAVASATYVIGPYSMITTIAGYLQGYNGDGEQATSAELTYPRGIALDASGNMYIADTYNNRIRKVTPAGVISTIAGNGTQGTWTAPLTGPATNAALDHPFEVAVDSSGNAFFTDSGQLVKVTPTGTISTVVMTPLSTLLGPTLDLAWGFAMDASGNFYVTDTQNNCIHKVTPGLTSSVVAGKYASIGSYSGDGGPATSAGLNYPTAVAVSSNGTLYIADTSNNVIRMVSPSGTISTIAGNGIGGVNLLHPDGLALDSHGTLFISGSNNDIFQLPSTGSIFLLAGASSGGAGFDGDNGPAANATFDGPMGLTVDSNGSVYIADSVNNRIRKISFSAIPFATAPVFSTLGAIYVSAQTVAITDSTPGATIYYTTNGTTPTTSSTKYAGPITVSSTQTLRAIAVAPNYANSGVSMAVYTIILPAATPTFSVVAGTYTTTQTLTIKDATAGATIYYTTNGTSPTTSSTKYAGPITVSSTETIEAIAVATNYSNSAVATVAYTITP